MELETINGIINVDLDTVSLNDVSDIISKMSVDAGVPKNAITVLYSGKMCGYSTNKIIKDLDNVRIIDNTDVGKFLSNDIEGSKLDRLLKSAIRNDITNGTFDITAVAAGIRKRDELDFLIREIVLADEISPEVIDQAVEFAAMGYKYEPTKGAWAIVSEQFIKATPTDSKIICLTPEADLTRTWATVEIPTALKYLPDNQVFGGYTIAELKSVYNTNGMRVFKIYLKPNLLI